MDREIFDLQSAADFLRHSRRWLRENCVSMGIEHERVGRKFRFTRHELERYLARHRRQGKKGVYVP
jgi:excisionase family DNA binding protein